MISFFEGLTATNYRESGFQVQLSTFLQTALMVDYAKREENEYNRPDWEKVIKLIHL